MGTAYSTPKIGFCEGLEAIHVVLQQWSLFPPIFLIGLDIGLASCEYFRTGRKKVMVLPVCILFPFLLLLTALETYKEPRLAQSERFCGTGKMKGRRSIPITCEGKPNSNYHN